MADDYTAPLGIRPARVIRTKRWRPRIWPFAAALLLAMVGLVGGWTLLVDDPDGGKPVAVAVLPALPKALPPPAAQPPPADDMSGQIIIRDP